MEARCDRSPRKRKMFMLGEAGCGEVRGRSREETVSSSAAECAVIDAGAGMGISPGGCRVEP